MKRVHSAVIRRGNIIEGPSYQYDYYEGGLGKLIFECCERNKEKICQICGETGQQETFLSFKTRSTRVALELEKRGYKKGDIAVTCSTNTLDHGVQVAGCQYLGIITSSLDPTMSDRDCAHLLELVKPKLLFVQEASLQLIESTLKLTGIHPDVVVFGNSKTYPRFDEFLMENCDEEKFEPVFIEDRDEIAILVFSSGTTGLAKAICLTHCSTFMGAASYGTMVGYPRCMMHFSTLYWISGILLYTCQFINGLTRVFMKTFETEKTLQAVEKYKVSNLLLATTYAYEVVKFTNVSKYNTTQLKQITLTGTPIGTAQFAKFKQLFPHALCISGYGMTEMSGFATGYTMSEKELCDKNLTSCGRPTSGVTIKVVDTETGKLLSANQKGEIHMKSDYIMKGYYNQDTSSALDDEGFIKSGDIGHYDEDGSIYVYDRIKDMFKYKSWHIVPAALEAVIKELPDVTEAVVFGMPDDENEHLPAAVVRLIEDSKINGEIIVKFVEERVIDRQRLRGGVFIVDKIPKTPSGKISRFKIRDMILKSMHKV